MLQVLHWVCGFLMTFQSIISLLALILLWILYPREENYAKAADLSLQFLYTEWSGIIVEPFPISWRKTSGMHNVLDINITRVDPLTGGPLPEPPREVQLTGGFYTEGEIGPVKVTTHVALTTAMLAWSLLEFPDWWARDPARLDDGLKLVQQGLEYVVACYIPAAPLPGANPAVEAPFAPEDQLVYVVRPCGHDVCKEVRAVAASKFFEDA